MAGRPAWAGGAAGCPAPSRGARACVVLPEPVSPTTTTTWFSRMTCSSSSRTVYTGRYCRCCASVLVLANSLAACARAWVG